MLIVAHRGGNPNDIENSATAFAHGIEVGADLLECDLQLSADGEIVVYHDTSYFGTPVRSFTTDELRGLMPTLLTFSEMLALIDEIGPETRLVLDLKCRRVDRQLVSYLRDDRLRRRSIVTSTFSAGLWRLQREFPDLRTGLSRGATFKRIPSGLRRLASPTLGRTTSLLALVQMTLLGIGTAALQHHLVDRSTIDRFHRHGKRVYAWTVDDRPCAQVLKDLGVDYLTTNDPADIVGFFRRS